MVLLQMKGDIGCAHMHTYATSHAYTLHTVSPEQREGSPSLSRFS